MLAKFGKGKRIFVCGLWLGVVLLCFEARQSACNAQLAGDKEYQLEEWISAALKNDGSFQNMKRPESVTEDGWLEVLLAGMREFEHQHERIACLKIMVEKLPVTTCQKHLWKIAEDSDLDVEIRRRAIYLAGMLRIPEWIDPLIKLLDDKEPTIRVAAIDAIGITRDPAYPLFNKGAERFVADEPVRLAGVPPIEIRHLHFLSLRRGQFFNLGNDTTSWGNVMRSEQHHPINLERATSANLSKRMLNTMLHSSDADERAAAARSLVNWTPRTYLMRVAEWGVWIDADGELQILKSVLEEIPEFVHETQNKIEELSQRINPILFVTKPIIHITVDQPLAVDVKAFIHQGQPWFAYPRPADFALRVGGTTRDRPFTDESLQKARLVLKQVNPDWPVAISNLREGYPWLDPPHMRVGSTGGFAHFNNNIQSIGLNWQSLIVSPNKLEWMESPQVEPRYEWWEKLRLVKSAWIGTCDEAERFLYYDGPTILPSPLRISEHPESFTIDYRDDSDDQRFHNQRDLTHPTAMLIHVDHRNRVHGRHFARITGQMVPWDETTDVSKYPFHADQVKQEFKRLIRRDNGLSDSEADGLISAWQQQFFETPGTRLLVRIRRGDYDRMCPLEVRPEPTEIARVGIVLRELAEQKR